MKSHDFGISQNGSAYLEIPGKKWVFARALIILEYWRLLF